jgi:hypothetical protein
MTGHAWALMSLTEGRQYAGNHGYADVLSRVYRYDSHVSSSRRVEEEDLAFVRDGKYLVGVAIIRKILHWDGTKIMRRCPSCETTGLKERRHKKPRYRYDRGHEFARPREQRVNVTQFEAHFGNSFIPVPKSITVSELKAAAPRPSDQKSIEEIDPARIRRRLAEVSPAADRLLARFLRNRGSDREANTTDARTYWVVSPSPRNDDQHIDEWRRTCVSGRAAFMGRGPEDGTHGGIGPKFAGRSRGGISPGDVILIARPHKGNAEMVGFGVVSGKALSRLNGIKAPETFKSLRKLRPFRAWSRPPADVPFDKVLQRWRALAKLRPQEISAHRLVCQWLADQLQTDAKNSGGSHRARTGSRGRRNSGTGSDTITVTSTANAQLDYTVRSKAQVIKARAIESRLVEKYKQWLAKQNRTLESVKYGSLRCDGYEEQRRNLIEAKSSVRPEHIRMAVGQLLHYEFRGQRRFGELHKAILLPSTPTADIRDWLASAKIRVIWPERGAFVDNADGQFA